MKWLEVSVTVEPKWQEIVSQIMMDFGIQGLEVVDPEAFKRVLEENRYLDYADDGFIDSFGDKSIIKAYFPAERDMELLRTELQDAFSHYSMETAPVCELRLRDDTEWKDNWKKYYKTFFISKRIVIKPSWENFSPTQEQIVIELEPGMAFGTGTHETTQMCAVLLDELVTGDERVLDLGCGTGILGIIASKLGAADVTCVDIDDAACKTARENIQKNHADKFVRVIQGELADIREETYDIIVINIIADVILSLLPELKAYCRTRTRILLSGIYWERKQEVLEAVKQNGFHPELEKNEGEWVALQICTDF